MYPQDYQPRVSLLRPLLIALAALGVLVLSAPWPPSPVMSRWAGAPVIVASAPDAAATTAAPAPPAIVGMAVPLVLGLDRYNQASQLIDAAANQLVSYYRRTLPSGGTLVYFVITLDPRVHIEVINADGATPGSDASGDTIWADRQPHLATVAEMAGAPYALRDGQAPLAAMAFGFHGAQRTSDEGSVVINGTVRRVNAGRAAVCITREYTASIGLLDAAQLQGCAQANGAGPVILWRGKIAHPDVAAATDTLLPFNPLGEDFALIDWRRMIYAGTYPKTAVGVGTHEDGTTFLVFATSYGTTGVELAGQLKAMGCSDALGGDDDTSTQAVWRGAQVQPGTVRKVPDALAVYIRP